MRFPDNDEPLSRATDSVIHLLRRPSDLFRPTSLLLLVEGTNDVQFLTRVARILHGEKCISSDLDSLLREQRLIFVPMGGGILDDWSTRFALLDCLEFFLVDQEDELQAPRRRQFVERVNARAGCHARLTSKRSLENYLHPAAISAAGGGEIQFGDHNDVADILVRTWLHATPHATPWGHLSRRTQQRLRYRAKRWLNTNVAERMTASWLAERDPHGEVREWLTTILELIEQVDH